MINKARWRGTTASAESQLGRMLPMAPRARNRVDCLSPGARHDRWRRAQRSNRAVHPPRALDLPDVAQLHWRSTSGARIPRGSRGPSPEWSRGHGEGRLDTVRSDVVFSPGCEKGAAAWGTRRDTGWR